MMALEIIGLVSVYAAFVCLIGAVLAAITLYLSDDKWLGELAIAVWIVDIWLVVSTVAGIFVFGFILGSRQ